MQMKRLAGFVIAIVLTALSLHSVAQTWPQGPVKFVLPLGPGSGADIGARLYADRLSQRWGQPVIIENRPGGDGVIAINTVLGAKDDHVLLWGPSSIFIGHPYTLDALPYNPKELLPVARVSTTIVAVAVPASMNVGSLKEFMAQARAHSGQFNFASVTTALDIIFAGLFQARQLGRPEGLLQEPRGGAQ